jgi:hypothetical protein
MQREPDINPASQKSRFSYVPAPVLRAEHAENALTRLIEQQTAKIPSDYFLFTALASMAVSLALELSGRRRGSRFIGMWVSPLLTLGIYNKLIKVLGPR